MRTLRGPSRHSPYAVLRLRKVLLQSSALVAAALPAAAIAQGLPTGGTIVAGAGRIETSGDRLTVVTTTQRSVVDWSSFSIGIDHSVTIAQPNAASINVNRVTGGDPSEIFGTLQSNGRVVIANPNGVWFGPSAHVDVAGIVASAGRIGDAAVAGFAAGGALVIDAGKPGASVVNEGTITVAEGGFVGLVAPGVRNAGVISARLGQVKLASGLTTTIDFYGDGLINLAVAGATAVAPIGPDGVALDIAVGNSGAIYADGGQVQLSANVAKGLLDNVINMSGVIEARGIASDAGVVELLGGSGSVAVAGRIDVSGQNGHAGGRITLKAGDASATSDGVLALEGVLDASSAGGQGGTVSAEGRFVHLGGAIHADGARGGDVAMTGAAVTQSSAATADGTDGAGGTVTIDGRLNVTQTLSALTSARSAGGVGGSVLVGAGATGRVFSSGTMRATGAVGGTVSVLAGDIALAAATLDASGTSGGGAVLVGGDLHGGGGRTAATTFVNGATSLRAGAGTNGDGGRVVVWSDKTTDYQGSASARGGSAGGDGGMIEVSSAGKLTFSGGGDAGAARGRAGTLLLDPTNIVIDDAAGGLAVLDLVDPNAGVGSGFGLMAVQQANGNIIVTKPTDTVGGAIGAGSVYVYDAINGGLVAAFQGSHAGDNVGLGNGGTSAAGRGGYGGDGITSLNYAAYQAAAANNTRPGFDGGSAFLILSPNWNNGAGAVTWVGVNGTADGVLSSANSLVGSSTNDHIGRYNGATRIYQTAGDNYLVASPDWSDGRGALTFASGATGLTGAISGANSLIGTLTRTVNADGRSGDAVGSGGIKVLDNGNYLILSPEWNKEGGAISFGTAAGGFAAVGTVDATNSLVGNPGVNYQEQAPLLFSTNYGFYGGDHVGASSSTIYQLSTGNIAIVSPDWGHGRGAVTLASGGDIAGLVSSSNSLVGVSPGQGDTSDGIFTYTINYFGQRYYYGGDAVGSGGVTELANHSYVVSSPNWNENAGAATFVASPYATLSASVTDANSLTGTHPGTFVGYDDANNGQIGGGDRVGAVTALANGNYVASTPSWNGSIGAVTLMNGTNGYTVIGSSSSAGDTVANFNSLTGSTSGDAVGSTVTPLVGTSDFVASSSTWSSGRGAVTKVSGTAGLAGFVTSANSLVGTIPYERSILGADNVGGSVTALPSGAWLILSPNWNKIRGAATFVAAGDTITGTISSGNSLVGSTGAYTGGVYCTQCNNGLPAIFGGDLVGSGGVTVLPNGNFLIQSPYWNTARGAATFVNGTTGALVSGSPRLTGSITTANSLVGNQGGVVYTSAYNNDGFSSGGVKYYVGGDHVGSFDNYGGSIQILANGNFLVLNSYWHNGTGAVTFGTANGRTSTNALFRGSVSSTNSFVGSTASVVTIPDDLTYQDVFLEPTGDQVGSRRGLTQLANGNVLLYNYNWNHTRGAITLINGSTGRIGIVSSSNSLVGTSEGDYVGYVGYDGNNYTTILPNGSVLIGSPQWNRYAGALTLVSPTGPVAGEIDATNSFIGNPGDSLASSGVTVLAGGDYLINSSYAFGGAGATTWSGNTSGLHGTISAINSFVGSTGVPSYAMFTSALADPQSFIVNLGQQGRGRVVLGFTDATRWSYARAPQATVTIAPSLITNTLNSGTSLTLQANNDIIVGSAITSAPGATGSLALTAGRSILVQNNIDLGNGSLTLLANDSAANGVVDAYRAAGAAEITFDPGTTVATGAGTVGITLAASTDKSDNSAGDITLGAISAAGVSARNLGSAGGGLTTTGTISATGSGTSILLATGGAYSNTAGAGALLPGAGRFLVYSGDPRANSLGGQTADGKFYGRTLVTNPPSSFAPADDLFLYSVVPLLNVTSSASVVYGDAPPSLTAQVTGFIDGDTAAAAISGVAGLSTIYVAGNAAGGSYAITAQQGTLASALGYGFGFTPGAVAVTPKQLTLGLQGAVGKTYDGTTDATLASGNYQLGGLYGSDSIAVTRTSGLYATRNASSGILVSTTLASGDFVAGGATLLANYILPTGPASAAIGTIDTRALTLAGVTAADRAYDGSAVATLSGGALVGVVTNDTVSLVAGSGSFADRNVGASKTVTAVGYGIAGADVSNYTLAGQPGSLTASITAKSLTLSGVTAAGRSYDGTTDATLSGGTLAGVVSNDTVTLVTGSGSFADRNVGTGKAVTASGYGITGTDAGNYALANQPSGLTASIAARALTLSGVAATDRTYDGTTVAQLSGGTLTGIVTNDTVTLTAGSGSFADRNVGTGKAVTASGYTITGTDAGNYTLSGQPGGLTASIAAKSLTVNGVAATDRSYDGTTVVALTGGTLAGIVTNDAVDLVAGNGSVANRNVGADKSVTASGYAIIGTDAGNYTLSGQPSGLTASIAAKSLNLNGVAATDRTYDGTTVVALSGGTLVGVVTNDAVTLVAGSGSFADKTVGAGKPITVGGYGIAGTDAGNYTLAGQLAGLTASIAAKTLTLNGVTAADRTYDGTTNVALAGGTLAGVVTNDAVIVVAGSGSFAEKIVGTAKAVTVGGYGIAGTDAGNYVLSSQPSGLTASIAAKSLALSGVVAVDRAYDGTLVVALSGGTLAGIVANVTVNLTTGAGTLSDRNFGTGKTVTASGYGIAGADAGNYDLTGQPSGLTAAISARPLGLSGVVAADRTYDRTLAVALSGGVLSGVVFADSVGLVAGSGTLADRNVGVGKTVTASGYAIDGADAGNYALAAQPGGLTATIAAKALSLSGVTAANRIYDGTVVAALSGGTLAGIVADDAVSLTAGSGNFADRNVGIGKSITVGGYGIGGMDAGNYVLQGQPSGLTASIAAKLVTLGGVITTDRIYDGTNVAALSGGKLAGVVGGDAVALVAGSGSFADRNIGVGKAITAIGYGIAGTDAGNYNFAGQPSGLTATIAAKTLFLSGVSARDRVYDGTTVVALAGGMLSGIVEGDAVGLVVGSGAFADRNAGIAKVVTVGGYGVAGDDASNYSLAGQPAGLTATITPAVLTVTLDGPTPVAKTYDGTAIATLGAGAYRLAGLVGGDAITVNRTAGAYASPGAGTGLAVSTTLAAENFVAGASTMLGNYALPAGAVTGRIGTITPASLTVRANDATKSGGTLPALTVRYSGLIGTDTADTLAAKPIVSTSATDASGGGRYPIHVSGGADPNYEFRYVDGVLTIVPAVSPVPLQALLTTNLPQPLAVERIAGSGSGTDNAVSGLRQSYAFVPASLTTPSSLGGGISDASNVGIDRPARAANAYANQFLDVIQLEIHP